MAYRTFSTETWKDPWFEGLSPEAKLLFIYLWTNDTCNQAGMYQISLRRIEFDVGIKGAEKYLNGELKDKVQWFPDHSVVWVKNFFRYQCANDSFVKAALKSISTLPQPLIDTFLQYNSEKLQNYGVEPHKHGADTVPARCQQGGDTVSTGCQEGGDTPPSSGTGSGTGTGTGNIINFPSDEGKSSPETEVSAAGLPPPCPHKKIIELYHEILPELPEVKIWDEDRQKYLRARWREDPERQNLAWWKSFFEEVKQSDFLMGRVEPTNGRGPFMANLEWLVRPRNFRKVIEGHYKTRDPCGLQKLADTAWQKVLRAISRGDYTFDDPLIDKAVTELGGIRIVRFWQKKDMNRHEKEFKQTYRRIYGKHGTGT